MLLFLQTLKNPILIPPKRLLYSSVLFCCKILKKCFDLLHSVLFYLLLDHFNPYIHTPAYSKYSFPPTMPSVVTFPLLLNLSCLQNLMEWRISSSMIYFLWCLGTTFFWVSSYWISCSFFLVFHVDFLFLITRTFPLTIEIPQDSVFSFLFFSFTFTHLLGHPSQFYVFKHQMFLFSVNFNSTILSD